MIVQQWKSTCAVHKAITDVPEGLQSQLNALNQDGAASDPSVTSAKGFLQVHINTLQQLTAGPASSACLPDLTLSIVGASVTIPVSRLCDFLLFLKLLLHLGADIVALRIVSRAVTGGGK